MTDEYQASLRRLNQLLKEIELEASGHGSRPPIAEALELNDELAAGPIPPGSLTAEEHGRISAALRSIGRSLDRAAAVQLS